MVKEAKILTKTARLADIVLASGCMICLIALLYFVYYYAWTGQRKFTSPAGVAMYYAVPAILAVILLGSLRLKPPYKIILAVGWLSFVTSVYGLETFLRLSDSTLSEHKKPMSSMSAEERKQFAANLTRQSGAQIDTRDRHEVIADLRKQRVDAAPQIALPLLGNQGQPHKINIQGVEVMPLGGIANKITVACNQTGEYLTYKTDDHGFHNPNGLWQSRRIDLVTVGNSLTLGNCVPSDKNFVALIRRPYPATLNLGMPGHGPLHILATLKEYALFLKPKLVLWFYPESNNFLELHYEKQTGLLMRYLTDDFTQDLRTRQLEIDHALMRDIDRQIALEMNSGAKLKNRGTTGGKLLNFIRLSEVRQKLGMVYGKATAELDGLPELGADLDLFREILSNANKRVSAWGGQLYFVYLPGWERYAKHGVIGVRARGQILRIVHTLGIPLIDTLNAFDAHEDPLSLFPFRGPGHYNAQGHRLVAETVLHTISRLAAAADLPAVGWRVDDLCRADFVISRTQAPSAVTKRLQLFTTPFRDA